MKDTRKEVFIALLCAFAVIANIIEGAYLSFLPYGLKIGLANIFTMVIWLRYERREVFLFNVLRVLISSLIKGSLFSISFFIAFGGIVLSTLALILLHGKSSVLFASICSAIMYNTGQLLAVMFIYHQVNVAVLLPLLILIAIPCGMLTAVLSQIITKRADGNFI
ncbi:MAG: Gx transporter family protein [Erysipelotrichaceae bacterium]|nr:Gx transporter family protein [Erysipelotrichaceae bacterium]